MEIPKSLENVWKNVSKDNNISRADYELLVKEAAPTGNDGDLDKSELQFLNNLKSDLEKNGGAKGSVPSGGFSFAESKPPTVIKESDIKDIPDSLVGAWNTAIQDGKLSEDDYRTLMDVASPNWDDGELNDKEKVFLGNLQGLLKNAGQDLTIQKDKQSAPQTETKSDPKTTSTEESPRSIAEVNTETDNSLNDLNEVNNILDALGDDPDFAPLRNIVNQRLSNSTAAKKFSNDVNQIINDMEPGKAASLSEAKVKLQNLYDGLGAGVKANPQITNLFTHAMGTLDSQINSAKTKKTNSNTETSQTQNNVSKPTTAGVPASLQQTWDKVSADGKIDDKDYKELLDTASPTKDNQEFEQQEINFLTDLQKKMNESGGVYSFIDENQENEEEVQPSVNPSPLADLGEVPDSLKEKVSEFIGKGNISNDDFNELVALAAPSGKDADLDANERKFLAGLRTKVENGGNNLVLNPQSREESTPEAASTSRPKKPVLLNWPGYTDQTKGALKNAFGQNVNGSKMPILKGSQAVKVANAFGVQNIRQLQQLVNAKVDGQFGPETFFKAKVFIANEMNKPDADKAKIEGMLNSLGSDQEVEIMKNDLKNITSTGNSNTQVNEEEEETSTEVDTTESQPESSQVSGKTNTTQTDASEETSPDDGVPASLKPQWNKVTADGKLTQADFDSLMKAAAPNKKNSEFSNEELEFLGTIKKMFDDNKVDVLEVQKPQGASNKQQPAKTDKPQQQSSDDGVPATLKSQWNKVTSDGKLTQADFDSLMKAAAPNKKNSEFSNDELEFLATIKDMFDKNKVDVLDVQKPQQTTTTEKSGSSTKTQSTKNTTSTQPTNQSQPDDGVPATLRSQWNKVTADGKLTQADFDSLMKAAAPNKKNSEFSNDELEFLAAIKKMFDDNKVDVLEVQKPQTKPAQTSKPTQQTSNNKPTQSSQKPTQSKPPTTVSAKSFNPPSTLKAAWQKSISDGKFNFDDFESLMKAASPNKKNVEFENDEIEFLADLRKKLDSSGGTLIIK